MVLASFGRHASLVDLRQQCDVTRNGVSAAEIVSAARQHELEAEAFRLEPDDLGELATPAILHWNMNHFVVLERVSRRGCLVLDPARGRRRVSVAEMDRSFTGIAVTFTPTERFQPQRAVSPTKPWAGTLQSMRRPLTVAAASSVLLYILALALPLALRTLIDTLATTADRRVVMAVSAALAASLLLRVLLFGARAHVLLAMQRAADEQLMSDFVGRLLRLPLRFFLVRQPGDLVQRVQNTTVLREVLSTTALTLALDLATVVVFAAIAFAFSVAAGALLVVSAVVRIAIAFRTSAAASADIHAELSASAREAETLVDALQGAETIRATSSAAEVVDHWTDLGVARMNHTFERRRTEALGEAVGLATTGIASAAMLALAGRYAVEGSLTLGACAMLVILQSLIIDAVAALPQLAARLQYTINHLRRLNDVMLAPPERVGGLAVDVKGTIEFTNVTFRYGSSAPAVVENVSVAVASGERALVIGAVGSGKSTLAKLIGGLITPTSGRVFIDGHDIEHLDLSALRRQMGVVLQESRLFEGTIAENIAFFDRTVTLEDVVWAAQITGLDRVVELLPGGWNAQVGEDGKRLSGGERQRVLLARALARRPRILILDEATSALDEELEREVLDRVRGLGITQIVITHRPESAGSFDRIFRIEQGRLSDVNNLRQRQEAV
jgi:ABC-type bacteriocin/lantibiotic exporter with double-glycine peptidase domain